MQVLNDFDSSTSGGTTFVSQISGGGGGEEDTKYLLQPWQVMNKITYNHVSHIIAQFSGEPNFFSKVNRNCLNSLAGINYASQMSKT